MASVPDTDAVDYFHDGGEPVDVMAGKSTTKDVDYFYDGGEPVEVVTEQTAVVSTQKPALFYNHYRNQGW
jgi:hypothetical protein